LPGCRKPDAKGSAHAQPCFYGKPASVMGHYVLDNRQAKARAADTPAAGLIGPVETLSETGQVLAFDTRPVILDPEPDRRLTGRAPRRRLKQRHPLTVGPELGTSCTCRKRIRRHPAEDPDLRALP
jgi:hypothetical protein